MGFRAPNRTRSHGGSRLWRYVRTLQWTPYQAVLHRTVRIKEILRMDDSLREITRVAPRFIRPCPGRMDLFVFNSDIHISRLKGAAFP